MTDSVEERLRDLEALVVRQAERIDELEAKLTSMARLAVSVAVKRMEPA